MPIRLVAAILALLLGAAPPAVRAAPSDEAAIARMTTLNLSAAGEVKAAPDQASISFGVQTQAKSAAEAMRLNADRMTAVIAAVRRAGVEARDIQTSALNLNGQYTYEPNQPPKFAGYQAVNQVSVIVHDLARLGTVVDSVLAAGVTQITGVEFGIANPQPLQDEARRRAVKALGSRAELYAGAAGLKLGRLVNLTESGGEPQPRPVLMAEARLMKSAGPSTPVEPGQLTVRIDVSAVYELVK